MKNCCERSIEVIIKDYYGEDASVVLYNFRFDRNEIAIGFTKHNYDFKEIIFSKHNRDLYLKSTETERYGQEIFNILGNILSNAYDELIKFKQFNQESKHWINSVNSNFKISISNHGVKISEKKDLCPEFELNHYHWQDGYKCNCNSNNVLNIIKGQEDEIFKHIFLRIEDCPN